jgi:hypothetical protein
MEKGLYRVIWGNSLVGYAREDLSATSALEATQIAQERFFEMGAPVGAYLLRPRTDRTVGHRRAPWRKQRVRA